MQKAAPVRTALLIYFVVVMLLGWQPWSTLLILLGAACSWRLQCSHYLGRRKDNPGIFEVVR